MARSDTTRPRAWVFGWASMAPVGMVFAIARGQHAPGLFLLLVCLVAVVVARALSRGAVRGNGLAWLGVLVAFVALWLVPQRPDLGACVALSAIFGIGLGLVAPVRPKGFVPWSGSVEALVLFVVLDLIGSQFALLVTTGAIVAVAGLARIDERSRGDGSAPRSSRAHLAFVGVVVVVGLALFVGFIGASTPDAGWFGGGTIHGPRHSNEVALTFDDGPNIGSTRKVAAILDAHGVKGTFFEVGKAIDAEPAIVQALYRDGQLVGNHSYHHDQWRWMDPAYPELDRTQQAFQRAIGVCPAFYRPPHGQRTPFIRQMVDDRHMHMVIWNVSAADWATNDARLVARRVLAKVHGGSIILLHDGLDGIPTRDRSVLVRALPLILDGLAHKGLKPVRLDQLLGVTTPYVRCTNAKG